MVVATVQVEPGFPLRLRLDRALNLVASRHHVRQYRAPVKPLVELVARAHHVGRLIHPCHEVKRVEHPRLCLRSRAPVVERLGRRLRSIEYELTLQECCQAPLGNKNQLPLHPPVALRTINGRVLGADVVVGH